jgi:hypothetical protein
MASVMASSRGRYDIQPPSDIWQGFPLVAAKDYEAPADSRNQES